MREMIILPQVYIEIHRFFCFSQTEAPTLSVCKVFWIGDDVLQGTLRIHGQIFLVIMF